MKRFLSIIIAAVMFLSLFATAAFADGETLEDIIYEKYEELMCVAHSKLDLVFGTSGTLDSLPEVLTEIFGYPATMTEEEIQLVRDDYSGLGNGQTAWPTDVEITFTDPATGESCEVYFDLSIYKCVTGKYSGAIEDKGFFGVCPEDWPSDGLTGLRAIATKSQLFGDPGLLDNPEVFELPGEEFTAAAIEAWYRDLTKLGSDWSFYCEEPDASKAYAGQCVSIALVNHNVNDEGRTAMVSCSPTLKLHSDPLDEVIDEKYDELCCVAHTKLDLVFGTSGTICPEDPSTMEPGTRGLELTLTDIFGYPATMDDEEILDVRTDYGQLGDGQTAWPTTVTVTFTNPATGETYDKDMDFAIYKAVGGKYCGAIEDKGFLGCCPDDWPSEIMAAKRSVMDNTDVTAPDFWGDEDVKEIPATVYTPGTIEAWLRDVTKLGSGWDFYIDGYDASQAYTGNAVNIGLIAHNVLDEGRSVFIGCAPTLKIAGGGSIEEYIDEKFDELCCVAHSKLDLVFGLSSSLTTDTLGAIMTKLFDYPATVEQSEIDAIKDVYGGLGSGQTAWVDAVVITFTDPTTGESYDAEMDLAIFKGVNAQYAGALSGEEGFLGCCPDDWPMDAKEAAKKLDLGDSDVIELSGEVYNAEFLEKWFRGEAKLKDDDKWEFSCNWLDEEKAVGEEGNEVMLTLINHNVNNEGRTMVIAGGPVIKFTKVEKPTVNFTDVREGEYYYDAVAWAVANGITTGTSATTFSPDDGCTRGQVVTFLWRSAGQPEPASAKNPFKDVPASEYYYKAVLWAVEKGITNGTDATHFSPEDTCTRAQIVTFLYRWQGQPKPTTTSNPFKDVKSGEYFYNAVLWAVEKGITTGTDKTHFSPEDTCTRAQVVTFMFRGK
ncbi:MAG: S-layer homology domain-containing protein [Clostridia bacterium]|nr:S-layer homology domain-containing protein [Clostridia bacterium]